MWTRFMDMHSGGGSKEKWEHIYIEADEEEAIKIFYNRFGHNPNRVTCTCCGNDYSIDSNKHIKQLTAYERGCFWDGEKYTEEPSRDSWKEYVTLQEYKKKKEVLFIHKKDIKKKERTGEVPQEGYVWV